MGSREKILKNIKSNAKRGVELESFDLEPLVFADPKEEFIKNLLAAGGEVVDSVDGFDVVLEAQFGVAENGACFLKEEQNRKKYTYYESIVIKLDSSKIVNSMHEAYKLVKINEFGLFMSGPSKTADIEQSLVIGAHGAKRLGVVFV